jgi:hypothetical protein
MEGICHGGLGLGCNVSKNNSVCLELNKRALVLLKQICNGPKERTLDIQIYLGILMQVCKMVL